MAANPKVVVDIITDASKAGKGVDEATGKFGKFNSVMGNLVGPATAVLGGITALGAGAVSAASDLQQAAGGVEAVFGDSAAQIEKWASSAAKSVGLSSASYQTFAAQIGAQLKNAGVPMDQIAGKTDEMIRLGADLAATYGGTTADAVSALGSAMRGEADPAERYGLALNTTAINAELAAKGQGDLEGAALSAAKAQAVMDKATRDAGGAIGQYARESGTVAGQQQELGASIEDTAAALGTALLPILAPIIGALAEFAQWIGENTTLVGVIVGVIGALAAAVIAYTVAQWAMNIAMAANPVGLVIAGIVLLVAAIAALGIFIATHTEEIRGFFESLWEGFMSIVQAVGDWFVSLWAGVTAKFRQGWDQIASFFAAIWSGIRAVVDAVASFFVSVWQGAVSAVQAVFSFFANLVNSIINGIRAVVGTVANWFASVWQSAVNAVVSVVRTLQGVFSSVFNAIRGAIDGVVGAFNAIVNAVKNVINWIGRIKIPDILGSIGGLFSATRVVAPAPSGFAASRFSVFSGRALNAVSPVANVGAGATGGTVININGGLDSADTIARRISQILSSRDRRAHGITITRSAR